MRNALRSCRLYSWMRLTWLSRIVSGSTVCPEVDRSHCAKADLADRFAARTVRAHDGQVGHAHVFARTLLDQARAHDTVIFAGEAASHRIEQSAVDLQDDLQMARQQQLEPREGPFFESLGQQRVVRVRQ